VNTEMSSAAAPPAGSQAPRLRQVLILFR